MVGVTPDGQSVADALQVLDDTAAGPVDVGAVLEDDVDVRDAEVGEPSHGLHARRRDQRGDDRVGHLVLDEVRAPPVPLGDDDHLHVGDVRDGVERCARAWSTRPTAAPGRTAPRPGWRAPGDERSIMEGSFASRCRLSPASRLQQVFRTRSSPSTLVPSARHPHRRGRVAARPRDRAITPTRLPRLMPEVLRAEPLTAARNGDRDVPAARHADVDVPVVLAGLAAEQRRVGAHRGHVHRRHGRHVEPHGHLRVGHGRAVLRRAHGRPACCRRGWAGRGRCGSRCAGPWPAGDPRSHRTPGPAPRRTPPSPRASGSRCR